MLYDNGVSSILESSSFREALYCIDCGRCKEVCPVFKVTGQYSPVDLITLKNKNRGEIAKIITKNTTFCANCDVVCPVNIPFTEIMIKQLEQTKIRGNFKKVFANAFSKRNRMNKLNNKVQRYFFLNRYFKKNKELYDYYRSARGFFQYSVGGKSQKRIMLSFFSFNNLILLGVSPRLPGVGLACKSAGRVGRKAAKELINRFCRRAPSVFRPGFRLRPHAANLLIQNTI